MRQTYLPNNKTKELISINVLEMLCVCINLAAAIYACWFDGVYVSAYPVLLNWCDSKSATCWVNSRCKCSLLGQALGQFFCGLLMNTNLGIQTEWLPSKLNKIADDISCVKLEGDGTYNFSQIFADHPSLKIYCQF